MRKRTAWAIFLAALLTLGKAAPALAHANLLRSSPAVGAILQRAPTQIQLWFSEDVNPLASRIIVWDRERTSETVGDTTIVPGRPRELVARLKPLPPGSYVVLWTSVSADDGHLLRGYFSFSVIVQGPLPSITGVSSTEQQTFPDTPTLIGLLAHWVEMLAAVAWVGAAAFSALIYLPTGHVLDAGLRRREHRRTRFLIAAALSVLTVASTVVVLTETYGIAGDDWGHVLARATIAGVLADQYGQVWVARQVLVLIAIFLGLRRIHGLSEYGTYRETVNVQTIVGLGYLYALAASGHASSAAIGVLPGSHSHLFSLSVLIDWLHYVADALWLGGQMYIVLVLIPVLRVRREPAHSGVFLHALVRFSPFAYASVAAFAFSGLFAARVHIPSWYAFANSVYGRALIAKMIFIGLMMLVSSFTVFSLRARLRHTPLVAGENVASSILLQRLLRWLRVNPFLGAGVLLATSVMFAYPVPPGLSPPGPTTYHARGGGMSVELTLSSPRPGPNRLTVIVRNGRNAPVRQASVTALMSMLDMAMGTGVVSLQEHAAGTFTGAANLPMGGRWRLQILIYRPSGLTRLQIVVQVGT